MEIKGTTKISTDEALRDIVNIKKQQHFWDEAGIGLTSKLLVYRCGGSVGIARKRAHQLPIDSDPDGNTHQTPRRAR